MTRDRTGEPLDDDDDDGHRCHNGWLTPDADRWTPCLRCRPWLRHRRPPTRAELAHLEARHTQPKDTR